MNKDFYTLQTDDELIGFNKHQSSIHQQKVASATALWADLMNGHCPSYFLQESMAPRTMGTVRTIESRYPGLFRQAQPFYGNFDVSEAMTMSDFPLLTGDVLDRMLLARYRAYPSDWKSYMKWTPTLRDFRTVRRIASDGLEGQYDKIPEQSEVKFGALSETGYTYAPDVYGKAAHISFQNLMNDDLDAFSAIPDRLGRGGARSLAKFATTLYVDASGPHASLYTAGNGNIVTSNPVLSVAALNTAFTSFGTQTDTDGEPIFIEEAVLVIPPNLRVTAQNIMNQITIDITEAGGTSNQRVRVNNWLVANLQLKIDPYIPIVASTANGATSWFLFANPNIGRPAVEVGAISGYSEPQLYQKLANTMRIGGGIDQAAGDFLTMSQQYKGIITYGGTRLDPKATVASNGSGS